MIKVYYKHNTLNVMEHYDTDLKSEARVRCIFNLWELPFYE